MKSEEPEGEQIVHRQWFLCPFIQGQRYLGALQEYSGCWHSAVSTLSISTLTQAGNSVSKATVTPCCLVSPEVMVHPTVSTVNTWITFPVVMMVLYILWHNFHTFLRKPAGLNLYLWLWNRMRLILLILDLDLNLHGDRASQSTKLEVFLILKANVKW